jgi:hypothetical protein
MWRRVPRVVSRQFSKNESEGQLTSRWRALLLGRGGRGRRCFDFCSADHCRRFDKHQGVEDPRGHLVKPRPQESIGGMEPKAARAVPPQDDQLMWQGDTLEFQRRSAAKPKREHGNKSR